MVKLLVLNYMKKKGEINNIKFTIASSFLATASAATSARCTLTFILDGFHPS